MTNPADPPPTDHDAPDYPAPDDPALRIIEATQTVLTALILAFIFRAFLIEAFMIPTGSMAPGLLGQHGVQLCPMCGVEFAYGLDHSPGEELEPPTSAFCPNCHSRSTLNHRGAERAGDRVFVHKWPYAIGIKPRRWDVLVFRDPANPYDNYIKRLVGLPGEQIEILDGDVFIRAPDASAFRIARKTEAAQSVLWMPVFDQSLIPRSVASGDMPPPWTPAPGDADAWSGLDTREIHCAAGERPAALRFDPVGSALYLQDVYSYNGPSAGDYVGDARVSADVVGMEGAGVFAVELQRDGRRFIARIHSDRRVTLSHAPSADVGLNGSVDEEPVAEELLLAEGVSPSDPLRGPLRVEVGHVDYRVYVRLEGAETLATSDAQYSPDVAELRRGRRTAPIRVRLMAKDLRFTLRGLRIDRDVYYTYSAPRTLRAYPDHPFTLRAGEFFVLGDNSPASHDSREWRRIGPHLRERLRSGEYQFGVVPADQIVGRAFFVYLPGLAPLDEQGRWRMPDIGRMRLVR